jgi:hypothetical protein
MGDLDIFDHVTSGRHAESLRKMSPKQMADYMRETGDVSESRVNQIAGLGRTDEERAALRKAAQAGVDQYREPAFRRPKSNMPKGGKMKGPWGDVGHLRGEEARKLSPFKGSRSVDAAAAFKKKGK